MATKAIAFKATLGGVSRMSLAGVANTNPVLAAGPSFGFFARNCEIRFDYFVIIQTAP